MGFLSSIGNLVGGVFGDDTLGDDIGSFFGGGSSTSSAQSVNNGSNILGSVITGGASLLGGLNQQSAAADQVKQQEAFQQEERLSSYPDTVQSLEAAGLNPVLAATNGPLGTPSGAMFNPQNILGGAVNSAAQTYFQQKQIQNLDRQGELLDAQSNEAGASADLNTYNAGISRINQNIIGQTASSAIDAKNSQLAADKAQADFLADLYTNHRSLLMSGEYFKNLISPLSSSAGSILHGVGQLGPSTVIDRSQSFYP